MKKTLSIILVVVFCIGMLAGCQKETIDEVADVENTETTETTEELSYTYYPLPSTIDINTLDNCTVAVSLEKGDAYVDETGKMVMNVTAYSYDVYDMVDIALLKVNDSIVRKGEEVKVTELERLESGLVIVNGGEENGGFSLISNNSTVFYEIGMSDAKAYFELGRVTLPVSTEFVYTDESELDAEPKQYFPGDFLIEDAGIEYRFTPHNTSILIENGVIIAMKRVYTP